MSKTYIYILIMIVTTYLIRVLPLTLIRRQIKNTFIKSFLYYLPYVTLALMTFPAIMEATSNPIVGVISLIVGLVLAFFGANLFPVAIACSAIVFILELFIK